MTKDNQQVCYTINDLAAILPLGRNSLYKLVNRSDFPKIRVGRKLLIPITSFKAWLEQNQNGVN
ncbi:helix-turn-helix domain-containing protein [Paenibacillus physcomitrellae]|uniref:Helix-turn-helix domain-containing protein n=1 Tax=Paenibacillus physcomitrellae TaxID=1619311 RepID=A0ABQ1GSM6_9BACL|nr:helix-turn-helix domain-containing protein [Paenibacillus physcomitrellae]GGA49268.1 hypothetical protein GCM10010917_38170 [Paenibacillus physcomitrellae]